MQLFILKASNSSEIKKISNELSQKKFKEVESEDNYILMKKRRYGNILIQIICLIVALSVFWPAIIINLVYFTYSYIWASPHVLITTETVDKDGNPLEYSNMDEIMDKATALL